MLSMGGGVRPGWAAVQPIFEEKPPWGKNDYTVVWRDPKETVVIWQTLFKSNLMETTSFSGKPKC